MKNAAEKLLTRGVEEVIIKEQLADRLAQGKKLRVKFGADPTAPNLHLGTAVVLRKLREFQNLGHKIIFIIGDYTAKVGDPSGRSKIRPMLSDQEIKSNAKTYFRQVGKILDVKKAEIRYNSEWYKNKKLDFLLRLMARFTAQRILERDDFSKRLKENTEIFMHELIYPLFQAYDSVEVRADVEIGGTDQKFNMLAGRDLQRHLGLPEQAVITVPLLIGTDGQKKMSKSLGNHIGIAELPDQMFGKIMSIPDELIDQYYELCTDEKRTVSDPRQAKLKLAWLIVAEYLGSKAAEKAKAEFIRVFSKHEKPEQIANCQLPIANYLLMDLLVKTKLASSKSEARRLIEQGAVKIDDRKKIDSQEIIKIKSGMILQVGKRQYLKLE